MENIKMNQNITEVILNLVKTVGIINSIVFILFITAIYLMLKFSSKFFDKILYRKETQLKHAKEKEEREIQKFYQENIIKIIDQLSEYIKFMSIITEKLQFSINIEKFMMLIDSFIGLNRDFVSVVKLKISSFVHSPKKESFQFIRTEIKNSFMEKVVNRLTPFIFNDDEYVSAVKKECFSIIDEFLDKIQNYCINNQIKELNKCLIGDKKGDLLYLCNNLTEILLLKYTTLLNNDFKISYMKGNNEL